MRAAKRRHEFVAVHVEQDLGRRLPPRIAKEWLDLGEAGGYDQIASRNQGPFERAFGRFGVDLELAGSRRAAP